MASDIFGLVGTVIDNRHRVDAVVDDTGIGVIYRGFHLQFDHPIAIKCLKVPSHFSAEAKQLFFSKFRDEGKSLWTLGEHSSIVRVLDFGVAVPTNAQVPYLVLEWLDGEDLQHVLTRGRRIFGEQETLTMLRPVVEAIAQAHLMGMTHQDLKPANLYLVRRDSGYAIKVLNFGIAKLTQEAESATQLATKSKSAFLAFSPAYGAPEQFYSKKFGPTGPWTDVHALGLILVELLSGQTALEGDVETEFLLASTATQRPVPSNKGLTVSDGMERLCGKALALVPSERYANAGEMLAAMDELLTSASGHSRQLREDSARLLAEMGALLPKEPETRPRTSTTVIGPGQESKTETAFPGEMPTISPEVGVEQQKREPGRRAWPPVILVVSGIAIIAFMFLARRPSVGSAKIYANGPDSAEISKLSVSLDGAIVCDYSPCVIPRLTSGVHDIKVQANGYEASAPKPLTVKRGEQTYLYIELKRAPAGSGFRIGGAHEEIRLFVDGKEVGWLPQSVENIPPGDHILRFVGSDRYAVEERTIHVVANRIEELPAVELKVIKGKAKLKLVTHGAKLLLVPSNGDKRLIDERMFYNGELPVDIDISRGWTIQATKDNHEDLYLPLTFEDGHAERYFFVELVEKGKGGAAASTDRPRLPAKGQAVLNINTVPPGAQVLVDGRPVGITPKTGLVVSPGTHTVTFIHPEKGQKSTSVTVEDGDKKGIGARF